jgi:hypothetical protein
VSYFARSDIILRDLKISGVYFMLKWFRNIFAIRTDKPEINKAKPEFKELEQELHEVDRILKMTDPEERKKYYPRMKELLSKISSYYENQSGLDLNPKEFEDFSKYIELMRELTKDSENTS